MNVRIFLKKDGVYDIYDELGRWIFSTAAAENVFARLSQMPCVQLDFVDEMIPEKFHDGYCATTGVICSFCQPGPCEHRTIRSNKRGD